MSMPAMSPITDPISGLNEPAFSLEGGLTMTDHLGELRRRILICLATLTVTMLAAFVLALPAIGWLQSLAPGSVRNDLMFVQLTPGEVLLASVRLTVMLGVLLASPMLLYQTLMFILPGLSHHEQKPVLVTVLAGSLLFLAGLCFAALCVVPPALSYLLAYGQSVAASQISIAHYVAFCTSLMAITGVVFELPMVLLLLAWLNLVSSTQLLQQWRTAVVGIIAVSAFLTPSQDPITMLIVAGAMACLYFASLVPMRLLGK